MIVIVVGSDKSGKSTLVENLRVHHKWYTSKFSKEDAKIIKVLHCINIIRQLAPRIDLVLDRFPYPDDLVYSPVVEGRTSKIEPYKNCIDKLLSGIGVSLIHLFADPSVIAKRYQAMGGDLYLPLNKVENITERYREVLRVSRMPWVEIDTSCTSPAQVEVEALKFINNIRKENT